MIDEYTRVATNLLKLTETDSAAILIGSAARGRRTEQSDIDILFIANEKIASLPVIPGYHVKFATEANFMRRLTAGEDFEAWCLRLGVPLVDRGVWKRIKGSASDVWPRWEMKIVHGVRRLFLAAQFSTMGDVFAASEELVFALGHVARALLLKTNTFPLSRPELADQVRDLGYRHLADLHERLRTAESPSTRDISVALLYSKKLLVHMDPAIYREMAEDYAKASRAKRAKHS